MARIDGRVAVRETGEPVSGLVVALYEVPRAPPVATHGALLIEGATTCRLGSRFLDEAGTFTFEVGDAADAGPRHLTVALLAPSTGAKDAKPAPIAVAPVEIFCGKDVQEVVDLRVDEEQLTKLGIYVKAGERPLAGYRRLWTARADLTKALKPALTSALRQHDDRFEKAAKLVDNFTKGAKKGFDSRYRATSAAEAAGAEALALEDGMLRLQEYAHRPKKAVVVRLAPADLLTHGADADALAAGERAPIHSLCELVGSSDRGPVMERIRDRLASGGSPPAPPPAEDDDDHSQNGDSSLEAILKERLRERLQQMRVPTNGSCASAAEPLERIREIVQNLKISGGPSDNPSFHDFHHLQLATASTWTQAFDRRFAEQATDLFYKLHELHDEWGWGRHIPGPGDIDDVRSFEEFLAGIEGSYRTFQFAPIPDIIESVFPRLTITEWNALSCGQQQELVRLANGLVILQGRMSEPGAERLHAYRAKQAKEIILNPQGQLGRAQRMILELRERIREPHNFTYYYPNSYVFGVLATYRQKWVPEAYQVGDLVSTLPLAPGETRRVAVKRTRRTTRLQKELDASNVNQRDELRTVQRAEAEILNRASTATNFAASVQGGANFGIGQIGGTSTFALNQAAESARTKRQFREAVVSAAQEYRRDHKLEVELQDVAETEESSASEITNPNNEITVSYLFYELERRYRIREQLQRMTPVILVAQDIPAPHEIDDDWLMANAWILRRALLDARFATALDDLEAFAGAEAAQEIMEAEWVTQKQLVDRLQSSIDQRMAAQETLQALLARTEEGKLLAKTNEPDDVQQAAEAFFSGGLSLLFGKRDDTSERLEAQKAALKLRLEHVGEALTDLRSRLGREASALESATRRYTDATRTGFDRRGRIDTLRVHVKENILHYMQAIWAREPADQRYFRLQSNNVLIPDPPPGSCTIRRAEPGELSGGAVFYRDGDPYVLECPPPGTPSAGGGSPWRNLPLGEAADLDNPLGFKGNHIMFALKTCTHLTDFMMQEYVDAYFGVRDPDELADYQLEELLAFREQHGAEMSGEERNALERLIKERLARPAEESTIIVPTGQLFIEALPGQHPLLESFKLAHRSVDLARAATELRAAELENLRFADRLVSRQLEDPEVERHTVVTGRGVQVETDV